MFRKLVESLVEPKRTRVGVIAGELLDAWQRVSCEKSFVRIEHEALKSTFAREFLKRHIVDGKIAVGNIGKMATAAFRQECAEQIAATEERISKLFSEEKKLWDQIYELLGIPSREKYELNSDTGEVFKIEAFNMTGGDTSGNTHPLH